MDVDGWTFILREGGGWAVAAFVLVRLDRKLGKISKSIALLVKLFAREKGVSPDELRQLADEPDKTAA